MKKLLLSLGTAAAAVAPLATVIACGSDEAGLKKPSYDSSTEMLLNDITEYTYHSGQFGSSRTAAITEAWPEIIKTAASAEEVAEQITVAAYQDTIEASGWEDALEATMIGLLGGTNSYGTTIKGWAWNEAQRLEKDILFADLENTVKYEAVNEDEINFEPGTDAGYVAADGEILVNDWATFDRHSGIGDSPTEKVNAVWSEFKDKIFSKQGFTNYVGYYGYGYEVNNHTDSFLGFVDMYLKDYVADNGVNIAFKDGTVIDSTINLSIADADAFFKQGGYSVSDNGDGTNTVTLGTVTGLELSSSDSLVDVVAGGSVTITANAAQGYTINGGQSEDFVVTVAAPDLVKLTDIDFTANAGSDIAGSRTDQAIRAWHRTDWEATKALIDAGDPSIDEPTRFSTKPISEAADLDELRLLLSWATYAADTQAGETQNAGKWVTNYQLENNVVFDFS